MFDEILPSDQLNFKRADGYNYSVLMFMWVVLLRKLMAKVLIVTYIHRVVVIDRYFRVYGICLAHTHTVKIASLQHTLTGRFTPRPLSCSLTRASTVSHQIVACVTAVHGCLSECCSSRVTNLAIGWISQNTTVHNCQNEQHNIM